MDARPSSRHAMTSQSSSRLELSQSDRARRGDALVDARTESLLGHVGLSEERCLQLAAEDVGPYARKKLKGILAKYRKSAHPFEECRRDQVSNGLPDKIARERCATLKDILMGTTHWRKGSKKMHAADHLSIEPCSLIDEDVAMLLDHVDTRALAELLSEGDS